MRILTLNTYCGTGSTGRLSVEIADYAAKHGAETIIGFGTGAVPSHAEVYALRIGGPLGRKWHGALRKALDMEGYGSLCATRRLIAFCREYKPDLIHLHNLHGCYLNHRLLFGFLKRSGLPVVWTLHDCWAFTGHCAYYDYVACTRWQTGCSHCPQRTGYPVRAWVDGCARNYRRRRKLFTSLDRLALVTPCAWLKEQVGASFLKAVPTQVIYNGVNRNLFQPTAGDLRRRHGIGARYLALAVASEWEERKGPQFLAPLAEALGPAYQVVALGMTEAQIATLPAGVMGVPATASTAELAQWYSAADCLINPTLEDNMPMVNLEALACGTPVVAFATGGCPEAIDESCGAIVPKGDVQAMAKAVRSIAPRKAELTEACLRRSTLFDSEGCAAAYYRLYQEMAE